MFFMAAMVIITIWKRITLSEDEDEEEEGEEGEGEGEEEGVEVEEAEDVQTESSGGDQSPEKELKSLSWCIFTTSLWASHHEGFLNFQTVFNPRISLLLRGCSLELK